MKGREFTKYSRAMAGRGVAWRGSHRGRGCVAWIAPGEEAAGSDRGAADRQASAAAEVQ